MINLVQKLEAQWISNISVNISNKNESNVLTNMQSFFKV